MTINLEELGVDGRIMFKCIVKKNDMKGTNLIRLVQNMNHLRCLLKIITKFPVR